MCAFSFFFQTAAIYCFELPIAFTCLPMADLAALLPMADKKNSEPSKKRVCLRHYDLVPAQMLNAMGASGIEKAPMKTLWETMLKGNKATAYFSEYCSEDADRQAIALSRFCEVMVAAIRRLQDPLSNKVIQEKVYAEASKEASELLPYLLKLNRGRSGGSAPSTIRGLAYASSGADAVDPTEVRLAAEHVYDWLKKDKSMLRSIVAFLSGSGLYYVAQCHEKSSRAFLECYGLSKDQFVAMAAVAPASRTATNDLAAF